MSKKETVKTKGRRFSKEEMILKDYFSCPESEEMITKPMEGVWFPVDKDAIDKNLFDKKRRDPKQEEVRQQILWAFEYAKDNSEKYGSFKIMYPKRTWEYPITPREFIELAEVLGDRLTNKVEHFLELAQRIHNGESWESICNKADTAIYQRIVNWNLMDEEKLADYPEQIVSNRYEIRVVGGSRKGHNQNPPANVSCYELDLDTALMNMGMSIVHRDI